MQHSSSQTSRRAHHPQTQDDPAAMRAMLQRHLRIAAGRTLEVVNCVIASQRYRDGSRGTVRYELRLQDPQSGATWDQVVTGLSYGGERTRRVWDIVRAAQERQADALDPEALLPFAYVPELDLLLQAFPHDHRLPGLARFMAPTPPQPIANALLETFGSGSWQLQSWQPETVQYRPDMRAIVQIDLAAADASTGRRERRRYYAKIYRGTEQASAAYHAQASLFRLTGETGAPLRVARPVLLLEDANTLVSEAIPGTSLSSIIRRNDDPEPAIRLAARAIARFHQVDASAPARPVNDELTQLRQAESQLAVARPEMADLVSSMVDAIATGLDGAPMQIIHGDLKPDHILVDGDQVGLIDFDLMCAADPMMDVAHLVAFLGGPDGRSETRGTRGAAQIFLDEYFAHAPEAWRPRLRLYHAVTSIHKAVGLCRRDDAERRGLVAAVLEEGQAILAGRVSDAAPPSFKRRMTRAVAQ